MKDRSDILAFTVSIIFIAFILINLFTPERIIFPQKITKEKVIVLGFDGVDAKLFEKYSAEGELPNLKALSEQGSYARLQSTTPAQSPVAWSTFSTGTNPAKHDVMDFIVRDPGTYAPRIGMAASKEKLFGKPEITSAQKGETFWDILSKEGIKSKIIKVPITFPAKPMNGNLLTGLGTPDANGTIGTFHFFTTKDDSYIDNDQAYNLIKVGDAEKVRTKITGPKGILTPLTIKRESNSVILEIGNQTINLEKGKWSSYVNIDFNILGPFYKEKGIGRFYLKSSQPELELYLSPISFNPESPFYSISYPEDYSKTLESEIGPFKTVGWNTDTWALKEEKIDENTFIEDLNFTLDEEEKLLDNELGKSDWNVYVQVFQGTDYAQHMFWRYLDPANTRYEDSPTYKNVILNTYKRMDKIVGRVKEKIPPDTTLVIMSDHGFSSYRKSVDLNSWLFDNGYLVLKDPSRRSNYLKNLYKKEDFWENVDWSKTRAYALGLGSLYINLEGREGKGVVAQADYVPLRNEIKTKLLSLRDNGVSPISNIYKREEVMHGPYLGDAGDLIIGFSEGYRVSWQTTFGTVPEKTIFPNDNKWSGDHCSIDPTLIPGVFLTNKKMSKDKVDIADLAPTILNYFGIEKTFEMDGNVIGQ